MYKYKYFSTHLQVFKQKVNLDNTSLCTLSKIECSYFISFELLSTFSLSICNIGSGLAYQVYLVFRYIEKERVIYDFLLHHFITSQSLQPDLAFPAIK